MESLEEVQRRLMDLDKEFKNDIDRNKGKRKAIKAIIKEIKTEMSNRKNMDDAHEDSLERLLSSLKEETDPWYSYGERAADIFRSMVASIKGDEK